MGVFDFACVLVVPPGVGRHWYFVGMCVLGVGQPRVSVSGLGEVSRVPTDMVARPLGLFPQCWDPRDWNKKNLKQVISF